jgi:hypothetical protein
MEITPHEGDGWAAFINSLHTTDDTSMKTIKKTPRLEYLGSSQLAKLKNMTLMTIRLYQVKRGLES